jgi:hypothetical protein
VLERAGPVSQRAQWLRGYHNFVVERFDVLGRVRAAALTARSAMH